MARYKDTDGEIRTSDEGSGPGTDTAFRAPASCVFVATETRKLPCRMRLQPLDSTCSSKQ